MGEPILRIRVWGEIKKVSRSESPLITHLPTQTDLFYRCIDSGGLGAEPEDEMAPEGPLHLRVFIIAHLTLQWYLWPQEWHWRKKIWARRLDHIPVLKLFFF